MIIPVIVPNNSNSSNVILPEWANITFYIIFNIVLLGIFIAITLFVIDMVKEHDKIGAIITGCIFYPINVALIILIQCMFWP